MPSLITTHVLDTARGVPAADLEATLEWWSEDAEEWSPVGAGTTDDNGRIHEWMPARELTHAGVYRLTFETGNYFAKVGVDPVFYPVIRVEFAIPLSSTRPTFHIPLLLSPYGYSTYRGS